MPQTVESDHDLIVFSHLRWHFVTQRPQHIISRLAQDRKVLFIEEPVKFTKKNKGTAKIVDINSNLTVLQPRISAHNFIPELVPIVQKYSKKLALKDPVLWIYSAMFSHICSSIDYSLIVYDCMDELAAFKGASRKMITEEKYLLSIADIVFTGGKSLYESKKKEHSNVYCFPSSVDHNHFEKAFDTKTKIPDDFSAIKKPIVGFYGVLDERLNLPLIEKIARLAPEISFVFIGPVVKISKSNLPRRKNIFYLGSRDYEVLPNYLKEFDVAMMPFALNKATKYISPTKTLEFMAALKPIVSTPIHDVVRDYEKEIAIANKPEEFVKAVKFYIEEPDIQKKKRIELMKKVIEKNSWDATVKEMNEIVLKALENKKI